MSPEGRPVPVLLHHGRKHSQTEDTDPGHGHDAAEGLPGEHQETLRQDWRDCHQTGIIVYVNVDKTLLTLFYCALLFFYVPLYFLTRKCTPPPPSCSVAPLPVNKLVGAVGDTVASQ